MKKKVKEILSELFDTKTFEFTPKGDYGGGRNETSTEITSRKMTDVLAQMTKQGPDRTGLGGYGGGGAYLGEDEQTENTKQ
jgi:hypothetical protein